MAVLENYINGPKSSWMMIALGGTDAAVSML
jgi:hypothetical protein